jgi:plastocyanin
MKRGIGIVIGTFLLAACGGGSSSGSAPASTPTPTPQTLTFRESEFKIDPSTLTLKPGTYVFQLQDAGSFPHDLHIAPKDGGTELASSTQMKAGEYVIWCGVGAHRSRGMEGTVTVK